jgi:hypothetical protein
VNQELDCNKEWGKKSRCRNMGGGVRGVIEKEVMMGMCDGIKGTIEFVGFCCECDG